MRKLYNIKISNKITKDLKPDFLRFSILVIKESMYIMKKLINLVYVCTKAQCSCKALDICHYARLPNEPIIHKETSKINSTLLMYQNSSKEVVKPHSIHVKLVGSMFNSFHQKPKNMIIDKTIQSTARCILIPKCLSCKKIQRKFIKFNNKRNYEHKKFNFLRRKNKTHIIDTNNIKQTNDLQIQCLQHSNSIKSSSLGSLRHKVQLNKALVSFHTNQNVLQSKIDKFNEIPSCEQHYRYLATLLNKNSLSQNLPFN